MAGPQAQDHLGFRAQALVGVARPQHPHGRHVPPPLFGPAMLFQALRNVAGLADVDHMALGVDEAVDSRVEEWRLFHVERFEI